MTSRCRALSPAQPESRSTSGFRFLMEGTTAQFMICMRDPRSENGWQPQQGSVPWPCQHRISSQPADVPAPHAWQSVLERRSYNGYLTAIQHASVRSPCPSPRPAHARSRCPSCAGISSCNGAHRLTPIKQPLDECAQMTRGRKAASTKMCMYKGGARVVLTAATHQWHRKDLKGRPCSGQKK